MSCCPPCFFFFFFGIPHLKVNSTITDPFSTPAFLGLTLSSGWRPERPADLNKMRERVWQEIKRLYSRKLAGKLIINVGDELA